VSGSARATGTAATQKGWWLVLAATVALALLSLASDVTTSAQLSGDADGLLTARWTVSKLLNAGVAWAGLPVLAGWLVRRPGPAAAAGVAAAVGALVVHYAVGTALGVFGPDIWTSNLSWFVVAAVTAGPLGLVGALARRRGPVGLLARLVVPVGALLEPVVTGSLTPPRFPTTTPDRVSDVVSGGVLVVLGAFAVAVVVRRAQRRGASGDGAAA
jgi:hypothetical protein